MRPWESLSRPLVGNNPAPRQRARDRTHAAFAMDDGARRRAEKALRVNLFFDSEVWQVIAEWRGSQDIWEVFRNGRPSYALEAMPGLPAAMKVAPEVSKKSTKCEVTCVVLHYR